MSSSYALLVQRPEQDPEKHELSADRVVLGRESGDIVVPDPGISNPHAELTFDGKTVALRDLASSNGTWHDGERISSLLLTPGAVVHLGQSSLTFLGVSGETMGRGRTVAMPQVQRPAQQPASPAAQSPAPQQPAAPPPTAEPPVAVSPKRTAEPRVQPGPRPGKGGGSATASSIALFIGLLVVGAIAVTWQLGYLDELLGADKATEAAKLDPALGTAKTPGSESPAPGASAEATGEQPDEDADAASGDEGLGVEMSFGGEAFEWRTVVASTGKDPNHGGARVILLHAAPSPAKLGSGAPRLTIGIRGDGKKTYPAGPDGAAVSLSLSDTVHYLSSKTVTVTLDRFDDDGTLEGSFSGQFDLEVNGKLQKPVEGKGKFRAQIR